MANWSDTVITFDFINLFQMKSTINNIQNHIIDDYFSNNYEYMQINTFVYNYEKLWLTIEANSKWSAPIDYFKELVQRYKLSGKLVDLECSDNFFYLIQWEKGKIIEEVDTPYMSKRSIDELGRDYFDSTFEWMEKNEDSLDKEDKNLLLYAYA